MKKTNKHETISNQPFYYIIKRKYCSTIIIHICNLYLNKSNNALYKIYLFAINMQYYLLLLHLTLRITNNKLTKIDAKMIFFITYIKQCFFAFVNLKITFLFCKKKKNETIQNTFTLLKLNY